MLLSIVMMVKNEEKYLDKTLYALNDLRKDIYSELIILDTGSTDNTVEIAKKYTDKVYFSKWNDNFADMRNISISYAKGDWILILDADEKLTNYNKLKKFFNSKLCEKYNSATIELKSFHNKDEKNYSIASILRLFKNEDEFKYEGAIHEQPIYKAPVYNDIASFDHYGYIYVDEEIRQKKTKRNIELLLKEIAEKPNDSYTNYQLGKTYVSDFKHNEAIYYLEKSFDLYKKTTGVPLYLIGDLLNVYTGLKLYTKAEDLCREYIEKDQNNIDVYYYMAISKMNLGRYQESVECFDRYLYLLNNYDISTQANRMDCVFNTAQYNESCKSSIIYLYYKLEMYDKIVENINDLSEEEIKDNYYIIFESLYKLNLEARILELYNKFPKYNSSKNDFKLHLELFLKSVKESDKDRIYKLLSNIEDNYGKLNELRVGSRFLLSEYNYILNNEDATYYGEILYYALKQGFELESVLKNVSYSKIQNYIGYLIINKREIILDMYEYLISLNNTLNIEKLCIYSSLSKSLLKYANLINDKYEKLFLLYVKYSYDIIRKIYNESLSDEEILNLLKDREDIFVFKINIIQKNKNKDLIKYISDMRSLVNDYREYKDAIEILINKFETEFNEGEELKSLKKQYKSIVENSIQLGKFGEAMSMIKEYETMFNKDSDILNMKGIIAMYKGNLEEAELLFKESTIFEINYNTMFNIAYLKEAVGDIEEAISFYKRIILSCEDENIVFDAQKRINLLNKN